jgi:hypothetical protein
MALDGPEAPNLLISKSEPLFEVFEVFLSRHHAKIGGNALPWDSPNQ